MSDRLALAHAIEDAGIERSKAENVASVIVRLVEGSVATTAQLDAAKAELKADIQASNAEIARVEAAVKAEIATLRGEMTGLRGEMTGLRGEVRTELARLDAGLERLRSTVREQENRLLLRLGSLMVVLTGVVLAALRYWPAH